ncbi:thioredoxin 2, putative [Plasmodium gallinaceum]|uniref:Thioredoxin 2 n=1 Tax=Plasmodium gallinaceum TaxID=5849 RepID=A0A1J1GRR3_PLAGA|nr:thioredoxin 2, putative [Plasmodium gallinaceum]CRG95157.1 thioredoxin 2, putative [Plasmodium gallinaceum]
MKFTILLSFFFFINFLYFVDVECTKSISFINEDPLTPLNKYDKYHLRLFKRVARLENVKNSLNGLSTKNKVIILYFYAKWCPACSMQSGEMDKLEKFYGKQINLFRINLDEYKKLAKKYSVVYLPTIIIMKNNVVLARKDHYTSSSDLINLIKKHL